MNYLIALLISATVGTLVSAVVLQLAAKLTQKLDVGFGTACKVGFFLAIADFWFAIMGAAISQATPDPRFLVLAVAIGLIGTAFAVKAVIISSGLEVVLSRASIISVAMFAITAVVLGGVIYTIDRA